MRTIRIVGMAACILFVGVIFAAPAGAGIVLRPPTPAGAATPNLGIGQFWCEAGVKVPQLHVGAYGLPGVVTVFDYVVCDTPGVIVGDDLWLYEDLVPQGESRYISKLCQLTLFGCIATNEASAVCKHLTNQAWYGNMQTEITDPALGIAGLDNNYPDGYNGPGVTLPCQTW